MGSVAELATARESDSAWRAARPASAPAADEHRDEMGGALGRVIGAAPGGAPPPEIARLFGGTALAHRASHNVRAVALRRAQQVYGNRVAQRLVQRTCACGGTCDRCTSSARRVVQARAAGTGGPESKLRTDDIAPAASHGSPLDGDTRRFMEDRFGTSFDHVRVHTDGRAAASAKALGADAYTFGRDIYFAAGKYAAGSRDGRRLLAHELAHTVQQGASAEGAEIATKASDDVVVGAADDPMEEEADRAADAVMEGASTAIHIKESPGLVAQRQPQVGASEENAITFRGKRLVNEREALRKVAIELITESGHLQATWFVNGLQGTLRRKSCHLAGCIDFPAQAPADTPHGASLTRDIVKVLGEELSAIKKDHDAFKQLVKSAAQVRLERNRQSLAQWASFIGTVITPDEARDELLAQGVRELSMKALQHPKQGIAMRALDEMVTTHSPAYQRTNAAIIKGEINGGCMHCHVLRVEIERDYDKLGFNRFRPSILETLRASSGLDRDGPSFGSNSGRGEGMPSCAFRRTAQYPAITETFSLLNRIRPYMRPLGSSGYRIIPDKVFDTSVTAGEVVASALKHIEDRRTDLEKVKEQVGKAGFDYLKLPEVLNSLLVTQNDGVKAMVADELKQRAENAEQNALLGLFLNGISLLLIIFPPTAPAGILIGAGLAVHGLVEGSAQYREGSMLASARGADDVFTREQQAAADELMLSGLFTMALSAANLAGTALQGIKVIRNGAAIAQAEARAGKDLIVIKNIESGAPEVIVQGSSGGSRVVRQLAAGEGAAFKAGTTVQRGPVTATMQGDGSIVVTNASRPDLLYIVRGETGTLYQVFGEGGGMRVVASESVTRGAAAMGEPLALARASSPSQVAPKSAGPPLLGTGFGTGVPWNPYWKSGRPDASRALVPAFSETSPGGPLLSGGISNQQGPLTPTFYNPCGNSVNCGFVSIARALHLTTGTATNADLLYVRTLQDLRLPIDTPVDPLWRRLLFPDQDLSKVKTHAGYAPLFEGTGNPGNYTVTAVARARGLTLQQVNATDRFVESRMVFHPEGAEAALEARLEQLNINPEDPNMAIRIGRIRETILEGRRTIPGEYIIGSKTKQHYMNLRIKDDGTIIGIDEQDGKVYDGLTKILDRMGGIDLMLKVEGTGGNLPLFAPGRIPPGGAP